MSDDLKKRTFNFNSPDDIQLTTENLSKFETGSKSPSRGGSRLGSVKASSNRGGGSVVAFDDNFNMIDDILNDVKNIDKPEEFSNEFKPEKIEHIQNVKIPSGIDFGVGGIVNKDIIKTISDDDKIAEKIMNQALQSSEIISLPLNRKKPIQIKAGFKAEHKQPVPPPEPTELPEQNPFLNLDASPPPEKDSFITKLKNRTHNDDKKYLKIENEDEPQLESFSNINFDENLGNDNFGNDNFGGLNGGNENDMEHEYVDNPEDQFDGRNENRNDEENDNKEEEKPKAPKVKMTREELMRAKRSELTKLEKLIKRGGQACKEYSMADTYDDIKEECLRVEEEVNLEKGIRNQRNWLIQFANGLEYFSENIYNPLGLQLEGFSENVSENISQYDEVFEKLYIKYKDRLDYPPEIELLMMFLGSAAMFHFSKAVINKANAQVPGFNDVINSNPNLKREYEATAMKIASEKGQGTDIAQKTSGLFGKSGFNNVLGGLFSKQPPQQQQQQQQIPQPQQFQQTRIIPQKPQQQQQQLPQNLKDIKIDGPTGVDDVLESFINGTNQGIKEKKFNNGSDTEMSEFMINKTRTTKQ